MEENEVATKKRHMMQNRKQMLTSKTKLIHIKLIGKYQEHNFKDVRKVMTAQKTTSISDWNCVTRDSNPTARD